MDIRSKRMVLAMIQFGCGAVPPVSMFPMDCPRWGVGVGCTPNLAGAIVAGSLERAAQSLSPSVWSVKALLVNTARSLVSS